MLISVRLTRNKKKHYLEFIMPFKDTWAYHISQHLLILTIGWTPMQVAGVLFKMGGGGDQQNFRLNSKVHPFTLLYTIFDWQGSPFMNLSRNISKTSARTSSWYPDTQKQMKARAFIVSSIQVLTGGLELWIFHEFVKDKWIFFNMPNLNTTSL